ncbi:MAG: bifunctional diguanylate cyclase/phosphodiesterase [Pseudomonadota bacterium]
MKVKKVKDPPGLDSGERSFIKKWRLGLAVVSNNALDQPRPLTINNLNRNQCEQAIMSSPRPRRLDIQWKAGRPLGLMVFSIKNLFSFERIFGEAIKAAALHGLNAAFRDVHRQYLAEAELVFTENLEDGGLVIIFQREDLDINTLADLTMTFRLFLRNALNVEMVKVIGQKLDLKAGFSRFIPREGVDPEHIVFQALCDAYDVAEGSLNPDKLRLMGEFRRILEGPGPRAVYMPIVDLKTGGVLGWEALSRGPENSRFHSPSVLFDFAEEAGALFALERVCREAAIKNLGGLDQGQKLFLNIHPQTVGDPNFTAGETRRLLARHGLKPENIVFEITERHPIRDFTLFFRTLEHYRSQGYQAAIDDVGAGYAGLWALGQIRPEYIKIDMSLIRGVDANPINRALVETLVSFADKIGGNIIAEGIETETELSSLMDMGVHYGQGFYLARPDNPKPLPINIQIRTRPRPREEAGRLALPIGELAEPALQLAPNVKISEVQHLFESVPPSPISGAVIVDGANKPIGLVMNHELNRQLGTLYGVALYYERPIVKLMDPSPLIMEEGVPVEIAAEKAMERERYKVYDHILVTRDGALVGVVSVQKMLDRLARVQVEMAKGANPLTGLPGNVAIEREIESRAQSPRATSLIYADLDHFKVYNDLYGFDAGDKMILLLSRIMAWAARRHGGPNGYVGHIGGDDFVIITHPEQAENICRGIIRCFKRLVLGFYAAGDRERGFIEGKNRSGEPDRFPLTSVSLAIIDCHGALNIHTISQRAAEMKKYAKSIEGNVFVRDRRKPVEE